MVDKNDNQKPDDKTIKLRIRSNTEDIILKEKKETQFMTEHSDSNKGQQPVQFYDQKMRDVWGSKFVPQANTDPSKDISMKIDCKPSSVDKAKLSSQMSNFTQEKPKPMLIDSVPVNNNKSSEKKIDKEHVAIEKIFRISLSEKENFLYLKQYSESLSEKAFRLNDLDSIVLTIITSNEKKNNIFSYLLETYYRAYEMIDKKYKSEFDGRFQLIKKTVVSYINVVLNAPDDFDINLSRDSYYSDFKKFFIERDSEYIENFIADFTVSTSADTYFLKNFYSFYFEYFYQELAYSQNPNYYNYEKIRKHLKILTKVINDFPIVAESLCEYDLFLPKNITNGRTFQLNSFLGTIFSLSPMDCDINILVSSISTKSPEDNKKSALDLTKNFSVYISEVSKLIFSLLRASEMSRRITLKWFYDCIAWNIDRKKTLYNPQTISKLGFLMNIIYILIKILYDNKILVDGSTYCFTKEIQPLFSLTNHINFSSFERINNESYNEMLQNNKPTIQTVNFNLETCLFFIINTLLSFTMKTIEAEYYNLKKKFNEFIEQDATNDINFKECTCLKRAYEVYLKNNEFCKYVFKFTFVNIALFFSLNNSKFTPGFLKQTNTQDSVVSNSFHNYMENCENKIMSSLPLILVQNVLYVYICLRINSPEVLIADINTVKQYAYFSIIYSSNSNFITTSHFRTELLDLILFVFTVQSFETKLQGYSSFTGMLQDPFILKNMISSLMKSFIDAERLGTANQFYQKFSNRSRILSILIDIVLKHYKVAYTTRIIEFANSQEEDSLRMINLMMNDVTYLNDEAIEKLEQIKIYQDLRENSGAYDALDEETKKLEDEKFTNNDRIAKVEIRLLNQSIQYMTIICNCCSQNFIKSGLAERLANLLNYSLSIFTTSKGMKLKIKNMKDYGFDPKMMLTNLISIYSSLRTSKKFLSFIVKDPRSFKLEHFEKVIRLYEKKKIEVKDSSEIEGFSKMIEDLKEIEKEIKKQEINYDDAPEEFLDQLNYTLMNDPVLLPSSKVVLDRSTIETHLLSDQTDPFNRSKLTKELLIPCFELKERIEKYKKSKMNS